MHTPKKANSLEDNDSIDSYFECITACSLDESGVECLTKCVEVHLKEDMSP
tara:strand:+ start:1008 stop:1160 length:153 start_codon:yes stop_codon:yes gene_type:complete